MNLGKRILSAFLSVLMIFSAVPVSVVSALDETEPSGTAAVTEKTALPTPSAEETMAAVDSIETTEALETTEAETVAATKESVSSTEATDETEESLSAESEVILTPEQVRAVLSRTDGDWLFPLEERFYGSLRSHCGALENRSCVFCGEVHEICPELATPAGQWGLEIQTEPGNPVFAPRDGVVRILDAGRIILEHPIAEKSLSYYTLLTGFATQNAVEGASVRSGDILGTSSEQVTFSLCLAPAGLDFSETGELIPAEFTAYGWAEQADTAGMICNTPDVGTVTYTFHIQQEIPQAPEANSVPDTPADSPTERLPAPMGNSTGQSGVFPTGLVWNLTDTGVLYITGSGRMPDYVETSIRPWPPTNTTIKEVIIEPGVTNVGSHIFFQFFGLERVTIPDTVTEIGEGAFEYCKVLSEVTIPDSVTKIGPKAFALDGHLNRITIPKSVTSIGKDAFDGSNIREVHISDLDTWYQWDFPTYATNPCNRGADLYLNSALVTEVTIPQGTETAKPYLFYGCKSIQKVVVPDSVTEIGACAFQNCTSLTSVDLPDSIKLIDRYAFRNTALTSLWMPANRLTLRRYSIPSDLKELHIKNLAYWCNTEIEAPEKDKGLWFSCGDLYLRDQLLTELEIPRKITQIYPYVFSYCDSIKHVVIPSDVRFINQQAFDADYPITDVYYEGSEREWGFVDIDNTNNGNQVILNAKMHYDHVISQDLDEIDLNNFAVIVKENTNAANKETEDFVLSAGAKIKPSAMSKEYTTDSYGSATLADLSESNIQFYKDGYVSRTLTLDRLKHDNTVYLQKAPDYGAGAQDYPVINALWMFNRDVLHNEITSDLHNDGIYILEPEVNWGKSSMQTLKLCQEGREVPLTEGENKIRLSDTFDMAKPIYLAAINAEGLSAKKVFTLQSSSKTFLDGGSLEFGDSISFTLPESLGPLLAGKEVSLGLLDRVPFEISLENDKFHIAIGIQFDDKSMSKVEGTEWQNSVKEYCKYTKQMEGAVSDAGDQWEKYKIIRKMMNGLNEKGKVKNYHIATGRGKFGADCDFKTMGYIEGYLDVNHFPRITNAGGIMAAGAKGSFDKPFIVGGVPCFLEFTVGGDLEGQLNAYINKNARKITPKVIITGTVYGSAGAGVGLSKILSISGGGKLDAKALVNFDQSRIEYCKVDAGFTGYAKAQLLFAEVTLYQWDSPRRPIYEYPGPKAAAMLMTSNTGSGVDLYDISQYRPSDLSYLDRGSSFMGQPASGISTFSIAEERIEVPFYGNAYQNAAPKTVCFADGTRLAVWVGSNPAHGGVDRLNLYYSYYNGAWTEPQVVEDDGTSDGLVDLKIIGNEAYLLWQDARKPLGENPSMDAAAPQMGLTGAMFDKTSGTFRCSPVAGGNLCTLPVLCADDSAVRALWVQNGGNDWFGQKGGNAICSATFSGGSWSAPQALYTGLGPVVDLAGSGSSVAYTLDTDGNLNTSEDMEVYRDGQAVSSNTIVDSGVCFNGNDLYWYSGSLLVCNGQPCMAEGSHITSDRFQIVNQNGVKALVYAEEDDLASVLYAVYASSHGWGKPIVLYRGGTSIPHFSAAAAPGGNLTVLLQSQQIVGDYTSEEPYGTTNLVWYNAPPLAGNLQLDDVRYDNTRYVKGSNMPIYVTVTNTAELPVEQIRLQLLDSSGTVAAERVAHVNLLSGETDELMLSYYIKEILQNSRMTLRISAEGIQELRTDDNSREITLGWQDLSVSNAHWGRTATEETVIHADIENRGYVDFSDVLVNLREDSPTGPVLASQTIASVPSMELVHITFAQKPEKSKVYYITLELPKKDGNIGNNSGFVYDSSLDRKEIPIDSAIFPDPEFLRYVQDQIDRNHDGVLSGAERLNTTEIGTEFGSYNFGSLEGIRHFTELTSLDISGCTLSSLDLKALPNLQTLFCSSCALTTLDLSGNPKLQDLSCGNNLLQTLDLSRNKALTDLDIAGNQLTALTLSDAPELTSLNCGNNPLAQLDLHANTKLQNLNCYSNQLTSLDLRSNPALEVLSCNDNCLTELALSENPALLRVHCSNNQLTTLDVTTCPELTELDCTFNQLTRLSADTNRYLAELDCSFNKLKGLNLRENEVIRHLSCNDNELVALNIGRGHHLKTLDCQNNHLHSLDLYGHSSLLRLNCNRNRIQLLSLGKMDQLTQLDCGHNQLAKLDTPACPGLEQLDCSNNLLTNLDVRNNIALTELICSGNLLKELDIVQNSSLSVLKCRFNELTQLTLSSHPDLTHLECSYNSLSVLDTSAVPMLQMLDCMGNKLSALDLSANPNLVDLRCSENRISSLSVDANPLLTSLDCSGNRITVLDVSQNISLSDLDCSGNQLTSLDLSGNTELTNFSAYENTRNAVQNCPYQDLSQSFDIMMVSAVYGGRFDQNAAVFTFNDGVDTAGYTYDCGNGETMDVTLIREDPLQDQLQIDANTFPNPVFREYVCNSLDRNHNGLLSSAERNSAEDITLIGDGTIHGSQALAGIEYFPNLTYLTCYQMGLSTLNVSQNPMLSMLDCSDNVLTELDLSQNPQLFDLNCSKNQLTSLDLSHNPQMYSVACGENPLRSLNLGGNPNLEYLQYEKTELSDLDLSQYPSVKMVTCGGSKPVPVDASNLYSLSYWIPNGQDFDTSVITGFDPALVTGLRGGSLSGSIISVDGTNVVMEGPCAEGTLTRLDGSTMNFSFISMNGAETPQFRMAGANMILGNELDMRFYIRKADVQSLGDIYAVITKSYANGQPDRINTIDWHDWRDFSKDLYQISFGQIAAKEMTDRITVQIFRYDGTPVSELWVDSVRDYAMRILEKQPAMVKTMLVDMLNYGAEAQKQFQYHLDDPADSHLSDAQRRYATNTVTMENRRKITGSGYYGTGLRLKNRILMDIYFENIQPGTHAVIRYTDHHGTVHEKKLSYEAFVPNGNYHFLTVDDLLVADCRQIVTITLFDINNKEMVSVEESIESYTARMKQRGALYEAIMKFSDSAYYYFQNR